MSVLRVLLVDDHPVYRDGLRAVLGAADDLEVVGEAGDAESAVSAAVELAPDVVLMDLQMPGGGVAATRQLTARCPSAAVLVLTMVDDADAVWAALRAGARGYLLKESPGTELVRSVRAVAAGESVFGARIADRVLAFFTAPSAGAPTAEPFPSLTPREREVLDLIARGMANAQIARRLVLSEKSVRNLVSAVLGKLHAADRAQAAVLAKEAGLGRGP